MKAADVRTAFLEFFKRHGHEVVASSSLVPANDPTLLFTNAGMVQFKDVFTGGEARTIWKRVTGFSDDRVIGLGMKDNFWMMGETGPMGPCSEIHFFMDGKPAGWPTTDPASWPGWLEIWNLVFMQFERRTAGGELFPLPAPSIDTGAGLERVTSAVQGVRSNYETDLFTGIIATAAELARKQYGTDPE